MVSGPPFMESHTDDHGERTFSHRKHAIPSSLGVQENVTSLRLEEAEGGWIAILEGWRV